jgi:hypothetical protein
VLVRADEGLQVQEVVCEAIDRTLQGCDGACAGAGFGALAGVTEEVRVLEEQL